MKKCKKKKASLGAALIASAIIGALGSGITNIFSSNRQQELEEEQNKLNRLNTNFNNTQNYIQNQESQLNSGIYKDILKDKTSTESQLACGGKRKVKCGGKRKAQYGIIADIPSILNTNIIRRK